jgi:hypothetical protein
MVKKFISLAIFLLVMNAGIRGALVFFHDQQFKDAVREVALFGAGKSDDALKTKVMQLADQNQIPLDTDYISIERATVVGEGDHVKIHFAYAVLVSLIPGKPHRFDFDYTTP